MTPLTPNIVIAAASNLNPEDPATLGKIVTNLASQGYRTCIMAGSDGKPSDHKVWVEGDAWTFISSDNYKSGTYRIDPYIQVHYDGSGILSCGIPFSVKLSCPSWAPVVNQNSQPSSNPPAPTPTYSDVVNALNGLQKQISLLQSQIDSLEAQITLIKFPNYVDQIDLGFTKVNLVLKPETANA